ncbi:hypothetical protein BYZ73_19525 [Rhodovulum viride]|uniref:Uncharacterized protein n=1 Tax=Rhodovulum viride TaxID=1231134 RepID=A0ABX9DD43_9RHOB|nr:hypothetical protein BYZ73_19525 [Rhodovulum viride]
MAARTRRASAGPPGRGERAIAQDEICVIQGGFQKFAADAKGLEPSPETGRSNPAHRLTWPERELVRQLGEKLYGPRMVERGSANG